MHASKGYDNSRYPLSRQREERARESSTQLYQSDYQERRAYFSKVRLRRFLYK